MTTMAAERAIFENEEWLVTESGLEHKTTGYFIARGQLADRREDGLWAWPLHMAEKSWCTMRSFAEAFARAASLYRVETGDLARSFRMADQEISVWPARRPVNPNPAPISRPILQTRDPNPILWKSGRGEKPLGNQGPYVPDDIAHRQGTPGARLMQAKARIRESQPGPARGEPPAGHASRSVRRKGTRLGRLLQAAWNTR